MAEMRITESEWLFVVDYGGHCYWHTTSTFVRYVKSSSGYGSISRGREHLRGTEPKATSAQGAG